MNLGVLTEVDDGTEEVEETLVALEWFEQIDQFLRRQLLVVLWCDLNHHLQWEERLNHGHGRWRHY